MCVPGRATMPPFKALLRQLAPTLRNRKLQGVRSFGQLLLSEGRALNRELLPPLDVVPRTYTVRVVEELVRDETVAIAKGSHGELDSSGAIDEGAVHVGQDGIKMIVGRHVVGAIDVRDADSRRSCETKVRYQQLFVIRGVKSIVVRCKSSAKPMALRGR